MRELLATVVAGASLFALAGCSSQPSGESLTLQSTCQDYLSVDQQSRYDAAIRLSREAKVQDGGNPMAGLSTDTACAARQPSTTLLEVYTNTGFGGAASPSPSGERTARQVREPLSSSKSYATPEDLLAIVTANGYVCSDKVRRTGGGVDGIPIDKSEILTCGSDATDRAVIVVGPADDMEMAKSLLGYSADGRVIIFGPNWFVIGPDTSAFKVLTL